MEIRKEYYPNSKLFYNGQPAWADHHGITIHYLMIKDTHCNL
ncbi:hypothetical protein [Ligilactobacillus acidipiscis]|nr:hypothetical protein [Ligilactobacillus acidipiscis]WEV56583.1 hypothetical protein OZX66_10190 [Ligilactobacillus acidipiscis]